RGVAHGAQRSVLHRPDLEMLSREWARADDAEHLPASEHDLYGALRVPRRHRGEYDVRPCGAFRSKRAAGELRDNVHLLFRHAHRPGDDAPNAVDELRRVVQRELVALPLRDRRMWLDRIVRLDRRAIHDVE